MGETFYGYCFPEPNGWHTPAVTLNSPEEVYHYTQLHGKMGMFREVRVTDSRDYTVVQMIDGQYVWPEEWKILNREDDNHETTTETDKKTEIRDKSAEVKA